MLPTSLPGGSPAGITRPGRPRDCAASACEVRHAPRPRAACGRRARRAARRRSRRERAPRTSWPVDAYASASEARARIRRADCGSAPTLRSPDARSRCSSPSSSRAARRVQQLEEAELVDGARGRPRRTRRRPRRRHRRRRPRKPAPRTSPPRRSGSRRSRPGSTSRSAFSAAPRHEHALRRQPGRRHPRDRERTARCRPACSTSAVR